MGQELGAGLVQVDLLVAEAQREPALAELLGAHAEALVERDGRVQIGDRQHEVIERGDAHAGTVRPRGLRADTVGPVTGNLLDGWTAAEYGRSRRGSRCACSPRPETVPSRGW